MDDLTTKEALAQGYISISEAIKQGLSKKDRSTLFRQAVSGLIPSCKVKKGSREVIWVLVSALGNPVVSQNENAYIRLRDIWFSEMRNGTFGGKPYSEETITNYKFALEKYWILLGQPRSITEITEDNFLLVLGAFPHDLQKRNDHFASKMKCYEAVTGFIKFLIKKGYKSKEMLEGIRNHRPKRRYKPTKKLIEDYEIEEAINANRAWRAGRSTHDVMSLDLLLHLFGYVGLRRAEAVNLRREDIFVRERLIKVFGKDSKERFVTPHPKVWPALEAWLESHCKNSRRGLVLMTESGQPYTKSGLNKKFQNLSERLGKPIHPHALRRGFAVLMANLNMPLNQIQLILGHENIDTTMGYVMTNYRHAQKWVNENLSASSALPTLPFVRKEEDLLEEFAWEA